MFRIFCFRLRDNANSLFQYWLGATSKPNYSKTDVVNSANIAKILLASESY